MRLVVDGRRFNKAVNKLYYTYSGQDLVHLRASSLNVEVSIEKFSGSRSGKARPLDGGTEVGAPRLYLCRVWVRIGCGAGLRPLQRERICLPVLALRLWQSL
jgi:hypothetical protein